MATNDYCFGFQYVKEQTQHSINLTQEKIEIQKIQFYITKLLSNLIFQKSQIYTQEKYWETI